MRKVLIVLSGLLVVGSFIAAIRAAFAPLGATADMSYMGAQWLVLIKFWYIWVSVLASTIIFNLCCIWKR